MRREWQIRNLKNMVKQKNVVKKKREERMADQEFKKMWHGKKFEKFEKFEKRMADQKFKKYGEAKKCDKKKM